MVPCFAVNVPNQFQMFPGPGRSHTTWNLLTKRHINTPGFLLNWQWQAENVLQCDTVLGSCAQLLDIRGAVSNNCTARPHPPSPRDGCSELVYSLTGQLHFHFKIRPRNNKTKPSIAPVVICRRACTAALKFSSRFGYVQSPLRPC